MLELSNLEMALNKCYEQNDQLVKDYEELKKIKSN